MKKINFIRLLVLMLVLMTSINNVWGDSYCELTGMTNVRLVTRENDAWNYREFTNQGGNHFTYDAYFPANTSYYCQWNIYGSNWAYSWYIWDGANDNPYTIRSGNDKEVARMCFYRHSEAHATSNSFTTATSASGFTHLSVDYWGSYGKGGWNGSGIRFYYEAVANLSPSLSASTGTSEINGKATSTITASCTGGSGSYNYTYSVSDGVSDVTASTLSATSGSSVIFTAPAVSSETTYRITVTATDANSQLSGLASQTAYKDITVKATGTPTVTLNIDKINVNQIKLTGTITDYANYGSSASDLTVGFVVNDGSPVTTTFIDGNTFTKTITGLTANTTYSIKAYATNPLYTGYSSATSATTLTNGTFTIQVEVPHNAAKPKIYAWRNSDGYGGTSTSMGTFPDDGDEMGKITTGVNKDWYSLEVSNQYEQLLIYTTGSSDQTDDITAGAGCYWYNSSGGSKSDRGGKLGACPTVETSLYIEETAGEEDYDFHSMDGTTTAMVKAISLEANTAYDFKIVYQAEYYGKNSSAEVNRDGKTNNDVSAGTVVAGQDYLTINTDVAGIYTFTFNETTKALTVTYPEAYEVTFGRTPTAAASAPTTSPSISSGDIVNDDETITFTHAEANDYYEWVGWFDNEDGTGIALGDDDTYDATIDGEASEIWAVYKEIDYTVTVNVSEGGTITTPESPATTVTGHHVTKTSIEAEYIEGYHFVNWTVTSGTVRFDDANSASTQIQADENSVIQANFEKDKKIYFDNSYTKWAHVWIYLFDNETYWTNTKENGVHPKDHIPTGFVVTEMTKVAGEDYLYEYVYHNPSHNYSFNHVAFSESDQHTYNVFSEQHAAYRGDWCSTLPVYVATAGYESVQIDKDNPSGSHCYYHSGGYWRAYNPKAGDNVYYYWDKFSGGGYSLINGSEFRASGDGSLVAEVQVRLTSGNSDYEFGVHSAACGVDQHYAEGTKITVDNSDKYFKLYKYESKWNIALRTTSEGIYTFVLSQEYDSLRLSVIYPASVGDYRLTYSYDTPAKTRSSDIMKKSKTDAGSVHTSMYVDPTISTSQLVVERCTAITDGVPTWTAKTTFNNTYLKSNFQQNSVATKGVYEMDVTIAGTEGNASTLSNIAVYNGPFYIKTDCAKGGWSDYTKNALDLNTINFDKNKSSTFDYYFCKWIDYARKVYGTGANACNLYDYGGTKTNVKCVIANDYNNSISDTLKSDDIIKDGATLYENLPIPGSVRFSYNSYTNELKRTYLYGSTCGGDGFLKLEADQTIWDSEENPIANNKINFTDDNNWLYILNIKAKEGTHIRLTANYSTSTQYLKGASGVISDSNTEMLIGGSDPDEKHPLQLIYDFKTNKLLSAWVAGSGINNSIAIYADVIIKRQHQAAAQQISFTENGALSEVKTVYGVMEFKKDTLNDGDKSRYWRDLYWISFPFNVRLSDVFGFGTYGTHWIIERYDGVGRARNGFWADSPSNWKFVTTTERDRGYILEANVGYILALDLDELGSTSTVWDNSATTAYLYFPSKDPVGNIIEEDEKNVTFDHQEDYKCTINRGTIDGDRRIKDSYWHCIGAPSYAEVTHNISHVGTPTPDPSSGSQGTWTTSLPFLYVWEPVENQLSVKTGSNPLSFTFKPMHSYLVQYSAGTLTWNYVNKAPASVAARVTEMPDRTYNLALIREEEEQDHTYVRLTDDANVSNRFEFNYDLSKEYNAGRGNIWTVTADTVEVAGNSMPKPLQTTLVPVGVKVVANGEYTLAMPEGTNGENVYLIDNAYGTRTNLGLMPYTVTLTAGTYEGRFALEFAPIQDSPTSLENDGLSRSDELNDAIDGVRKVFVGGRIYIIRDGKVYDAAGQRIE